MRPVTSLLLAVIVGLSVAGGAAAQTKTPASSRDAKEIRRVIETQLDAFRRDDAKTAFQQAAPSIQRRYATPEFFLSIVKRHYTPVYRAKTATFGRLAMWRGSLTQEVAILGQDGQRYTALYPMQKQPNGRWRIAGCMILPNRSI